VVVADVQVELEFTKLLGAEWSAITAVCPPRRDAQIDANLGYNLDAAPGHYPAASVKVAGEPAEGSEWADLYAILDAPWRETVALKLWGLNAHGPASRLAELGKASSRAGSRRKRN
jgi:hypothetical protein